MIDIVNAVYLDRYVELGGATEETAIIFTQNRVWTGVIEQELSDRLPHLAHLLHPRLPGCSSMGMWGSAP